MRLWEAGFPAARPPTACARRPTLELWRREPAPGKEPPAWRWSPFRFRKALRSPRGAATRGRADHRRARDDAEHWPRGPHPAPLRLDRKSVVKGQSGSVSVDLSVRRIITK